MANRIIVSLGLGFLGCIVVSAFGQIFAFSLKSVMGYGSAWFWWLGVYIFYVVFVFFNVMKPKKQQDSKGDVGA